MIISVVSFKGGVGKTTTAIHLAALLAQSGKTVLIDGDLNRSASAWVERGGNRTRMDVIDESMGFSMGNEYEHFVLDTAARPDNKILKAHAGRVDLIIVPTTTDGFSLDAMSKTVEVLREVSGEKYRILLTMIPPKPSRDGEIAHTALVAAGLPVFTRSVRALKAFRTAGTQGVLVGDVKDPRANLGWEDYQAVGKEVRALVKSERKS